jgi:hypothetical protein
MVESLKDTLEKEEERKLICNRKINFIDNWEDFGLTGNKRIQFMEWYWLNILKYGLLEGLEEFKKL